jgi:hypothetical protein
MRHDSDYVMLAVRAQEDLIYIRHQAQSMNSLLHMAAGWSIYDEPDTSSIIRILHGLVVYVG